MSLGRLCLREVFALWLIVFNFSYDDRLLTGKIENNSHANCMDGVKIMVNKSAE